MCCLLFVVLVVFLWVVGCCLMSLFVVCGCCSFVDRCVLVVVCCLMLAVRCLLFVVCCLLLFVVDCWCLLFID